jgi:ferrochelatase
MNRRFVCVISMAAALGLAAAALAQQPAGATTSPEPWYKATRVAEKVWRIDDHGNDNLYLIEGTKQALLVDTGLGVGKLSEFVKTLTTLPVVVVNTHGHGDHAGGNNFFASAYVHPLDADAVRQMSADAIAHAIVICMAPHNSRTSVGLYRKALDGSASPLPFTYDFVESWHDSPLLVRAFAERLQAGWKQACAEAGAKLPVIFTAHSVPTRTVAEGDPYEQQAKETAALVAMEVPTLTVDDWTFAFQSQGMSGGPWLGPTVEDTILGLRAKGHSGVFVQPIGFVCDHVEVLYDVDIAFRKFAANNGMRLWRAESLNNSPIFIRALAEVARSRMEQPALERKAQIVQIK